jgi:hypothetical protein
MATQIRDTQFGHIVRFLSVATTFKYPDEVNPNLYTSPEQHAASSASSEKHRTPDEAGDDCERLGDDPEGKPDDDHLVDWYGPLDPEVRPESALQSKAPNIDVFAEPAELVIRLETTHHRTNMLDELYLLHRKLDLRTRRTQHHERIWSERDRSHTWIISILTRIRYWSDAVVAYVRNDQSRPQYYLLLHSPGLRIVAATHRIRREHADVFGFPVPDWLCWKPSTGYRRRYNCGHV